MFAKLLAQVSSQDIARLWRLSRSLFGIVNLAQPKIIYDPSEQMGNISLLAKQTHIYIRSVEERLGPFDLESYRALEHWFTVGIEEYQKPALATYTKQLFHSLHSQGDTITFPPEKVSFQMYMIMLMANLIGYHKWIPYDYKTSLIMKVSVARAFQTPNLVSSEQVDFLSIIYQELVINYRLVKERGLPLHLFYNKLTHKRSQISTFWRFFMRTNELLWKQTVLSTSEKLLSRMDQDAHRLASIIENSRQNNYISEVRTAAEIIIKYSGTRDDRDVLALSHTETQGNSKTMVLASQKTNRESLESTPQKGHGLAGEMSSGKKQSQKISSRRASQGLSLFRPGEREFGANLTRQPQDYMAMIKGAGLAESDDEALCMYYLDLANHFDLPYAGQDRPFIESVLSTGSVWDPADAIRELDMRLTLQQGPFIPGVTTMKIDIGDTILKPDPYRHPDLFLYVDASGTMKNPAKEFSQPTLMATLLAEKVLQVGKRVRVCSYDSHLTYKEMNHLSADIDEIMSYILNYHPVERKTTFPFPDLEQTYLEYPNEILHVAIVSDDAFLESLTTRYGHRNGLQILEETLLSHQSGGTAFLDAPIDQIMLAFKNYGYHEVDTPFGQRIDIPELRLSVYALKGWQGGDSAVSDATHRVFDTFNDPGLGI